ncbi:Eco29kI restriction endonuclease [Janthinobacterium sp. HH107]|uniref:Eco29kI family restriction endonuclease n=1 Tax=Janthinobacterium sp. HH107 TaxID=1537279 RepID=UPI000893FE33|nr:Eco29kI family restriction endonuclease [Janthinobacterium sp. HH107]OEZ99471.1 Eco29kI restriction endonuclease [Janthinobacterium sp. HH107]
MRSSNVDNHTYVFDAEKIERLLAPAFDFFMSSPAYPLSDLPRMPGCGVYGIFLVDAEGTHYTGWDTSRPIYVGKAVPPGSRQGRGEMDGNVHKLIMRLQEHRRSLENASNLGSSRFECRFMIMNGYATDLIGAMESYIIRHIQPLWNSHIDGFGNHAPGSGRYAQAPSEWDTIHAGRSFASKLTGAAPSIDSVLGKINSYKNR